MDISSLLEVEVKEGKASDLQNNGEISVYKNIPDFSIRDIASVRFRKLHCTACDTHIGSAPSAAHNMHEHPVLHVLLCTACREFYGDGTFEQGDDATDMFCRWCANGGNLYCCSYCSNTFCYNCIKRNFDVMVRKKIERDEKWKCFVCNPADLYSARAACWALLQHVQTVTRILQTDRKMSQREIQAKMDLDESQCCPHRNKRKRSETLSDDEEQDESYNMPKKKRRKFPNSKRKRSSIKLEDQDGASDSASFETTSNEATRDRVAMRESNDVGYADARGHRTDVRRLRDDRADKEDSPEESSMAVRQRSRRLHAESTSLAKFAINDDDDIAATLLECDQTMVEGAESLSFGNASAGVTLNSEQPRNIAISAVPMVQLMQRPIPPKGPLTRGGKTHRLVRGIGGTPVLVRKITPANSNIVGNVSSAVQSLPMVTIPSINHAQTGNRVSAVQTAGLNNQEAKKSPSTTVRAIRPRPIVPKVAVGGPTVSNSKPRVNVPPSVIDLDSDSDDPVMLVTPSSDETVVPARAPCDNERRNSEGDDRLSELSTPTTCPARPDDYLVTILSPTPNPDARPDNGGTTAKSFAETIRQPTLSIEAALDSLKIKIKRVMKSTMSPLPGKEMLAARAKTRAVNRTIKRTIAELNSFNDDLVKAYRDYKRERTKEAITHTESIVLEPKQKSRLFVPLEMTCTRDSEPECDERISDDDDDDDETEENSQNFPPITIKPFRRRVNRAIEAKPLTKCKAVQAYDVQTRDYETSIGYALLLKADYDSKRERDILRPVVVPDEHFGKYEDEFISYLQHIEDHGIETEETKELFDTCDTISINELVDADISAIIDDIANDRTKAYEITKEQMMDENVEILEEHVEIVTTKLITSDESDSSVSMDNSDDETIATAVTTVPERKDEPSTDNEITQDKTTDETSALRDTRSAEKETTEESNVEKTADSTATAEIAPPKNNGSANDEETVLAVRALIEDDGTGNASKTDILNSWKPVDSDDECTIID